MSKPGLLSHFFLQPDELPESVQERVQTTYPGEKIMAYAFCDLDAVSKFISAWVIITSRHLLFYRENDNSFSQTHELSNIDRFELLEGISSSRLNIVGTDQSLVLSLSYSRRQSKAMGTMQFVAEQLIKQTKDGKDTHSLAIELEPQSEYHESMLETVQEARAQMALPKAGVLARLFGYIRPHSAVFSLGLFTSLSLTALMLVPPYLSRILIDNIIRPLEKHGGAPDWKKLWIVIASLAGVYLFSEIFGFIRLRVMAVTGEKISMKLREDVYNHLHKLSLSFFSAHPTGSLITRVSSDTDRLWDFITFGILDVIVSAFQIVGVAVALLLQDRMLALLVLIPIPIMGVMFYLHSRDIQILFLRIWRKWSSMTAVLSDVIPGIRVVKAFAQEKQEEERFRKKNLDVQDEAIRMHKNWTTFWPAVSVLMHLCMIIVWAVGAPRVVDYIVSGGRTGMPLGLFVAFTGYLWMFWGPVQNLGMLSRTINRVTTSASRVFEVLDTIPSIINKPDALKSGRLEGRVSFENVTFSYDSIRNVLKDISFDVKAGEMIGLVGPSGGGKTTLVNLICRFYDVKTGIVRVDGQDVKNLDLETLRRQIGVVLQEPYLFHGTIAENIAYGSKDISVREVIKAAKAAFAHDFITGFRDGYETMVGERGQTLSGGERQRISIARAILHDPRILILDEATSSVDTETEKKIQEALKRLVSGRTTFAIAHRLSTLNTADRLFVLKEGTLVEHGTHAQLIEKPDGVYAKLYKTQHELQASIAI